MAAKRGHDCDCGSVTNTYRYDRERCSRWTTTYSARVCITTGSSQFPQDIGFFYAMLRQPHREDSTSSLLNNTTVTILKTQHLTIQCVLVSWLKEYILLSKCFESSLFNHLQRNESLGPCSGTELLELRNRNIRMVADEAKTRPQKSKALKRSRIDGNRRRSKNPTLSRPTVTRPAIIVRRHACPYSGYILNQ